MKRLISTHKVNTGIALASLLVMALVFGCSEDGPINVNPTTVIEAPSTESIEIYTWSHTERETTINFFAPFADPDQVVQAMIVSEGGNFSCIYEASEGPGYWWTVTISTRSKSLKFRAFYCREDPADGLVCIYGPWDTYRRGDGDGDDSSDPDPGPD